MPPCSSVPTGVDEEVGGTPPETIRAARKIERRGRPLPQPEQGVGDAWILIAFIVALGLIFVTKRNFMKRNRTQAHFRRVPLDASVGGAFTSRVGRGQ